MSEWISIEKNGHPETHSVSDGRWEESARMPILVDGMQGFATGVCIKSMGEYSWRIDGAHGEWKTTHYFILPEPPGERREAGI
jgi:hypothetical protein